MAGFRERGKKVWNAPKFIYLRLVLAVVLVIADMASDWFSGVKLIVNGVKHLQEEDEIEVNNIGILEVGFGSGILLILLFPGGLFLRQKFKSDRSFTNLHWSITFPVYLIIIGSSILLSGDNEKRKCMESKFKELKSFESAGEATLQLMVSTLILTVIDDSPSVKVSFLLSFLSVHYGMLSTVNRKEGNNVTLLGVIYITFGCTEVFTLFIFCILSTQAVCIGVVVFSMLIPVLISASLFAVRIGMLLDSDQKLIYSEPTREENTSRCITIRRIITHPFPILDSMFNKITCIVFKVFTRLPELPVCITSLRCTYQNQSDLFFFLLATVIVCSRVCVYILDILVFFKIRWFLYTEGASKDVEQNENCDQEEIELEENENARENNAQPSETGYGDINERSKGKEDSSTRTDGLKRNSAEEESKEHTKKLAEEKDESQTGISEVGTSDKQTMENKHQITVIKEDHVMESYRDGTSEEAKFVDGENKIE